ncbi:sulfur carrier protein ThiS [Haloechinothrix sp. LS1_15]|nr:sulfur carrier protein ThiS [Haloechinothrix sp. LS1_15]
MSVQVNAEQRRVEEGTSLAALLHEMGKDHSGIAVAMDGSVVTRSEWQNVTLRDGSRIEIMTAVQGG